MVKCWGLNAGWTQIALGIPFHDQWMQPPVPVKGVFGLLDGPVPMGWPASFGLTHKKGAKTYFDGNRAVQQTHDLGYLIPHVALPFNMMMLVNMVVSKHKVMFPVSSVIVEGKPMGTYLFMFLGLICSQPASLPTGIAMPFSGTVTSTLTLGDIVLGLCFIAVDVIIDLVWTMFFKGDRVELNLRWPKMNNPFVAATEKNLIGPLALNRFKLSFIKGRLDRIFSSTMTPSGPLSAALRSNLITRNVVQKLVDHFGKSWVLSPLFAGTAFQSAQGLTGLKPGELPSIGIGRAGLNVSFFPKFSVKENIFN